MTKYKKADFDWLIKLGSMDENSRDLGLVSVGPVPPKLQVPSWELRSSGLMIPRGSVPSYIRAGEIYMTGPVQQVGTMPKRQPLSMGCKVPAPEPKCSVCGTKAVANPKGWTMWETQGMILHDNQLIPANKAVEYATGEAGPGEAETIACEDHGKVKSHNGHCPICREEQLMVGKQSYDG